MENIRIVNWSDDFQPKQMQKQPVSLALRIIMHLIFAV